MGEISINKTMISAQYAPTADFVVSWSSVEQTIEGFGAADVGAGTLSDDQMDLLYTPSSGIGLSLLRVEFWNDGSYGSAEDPSDPANAVKAVARGAKVWAAPWSPPGAWKDNGEYTGGGHLFPEKYSDWADVFVGFYDLMHTTYGVDLYGMSPQNEPDFEAVYTSCLYSSDELIAFIKVLGPKLAAISPRPKLIAPEVANWGDLWGSNTGSSLTNYTDTILADSTAAALLDVIAVHDYTYTTSTHAATTQPIWQTEVSTFDTEDATITHGLTVASWVHRAMTTGSCSAWHYWQLLGTFGLNQGLLLADGSVTKRLFALGNWAKFVRPGWVRLGITGSVSGVSVTAFRHPSSGAFAIVAVNSNGSPTSCSFGLAGPGCSAVAPYVTSGTALDELGTDGNLSLGSTAEELPTSMPLIGNKLTFTVPVGVITLAGTTS